MFHIVDLIPLMPSPEAQVAMYDCKNARIPTRWKKKPTEVLLLIQAIPRLRGGRWEVYDFTDNVRRLKSLFVDKESVYLSWNDKSEDLAYMKRAPGASILPDSFPTSRFVVMDLAGTGQWPARKAGSGVVQLVATLLGPLVTEAPQGIFNFLVPGLVVTYEKNGDNAQCLYLSFRKTVSGSYITFCHVDIDEMLLIPSLSLITVRELTDKEY